MYDVVSYRSGGKRMHSAGLLLNLPFWWCGIFWQLFFTLLPCTDFEPTVSFLDTCTHSWLCVYYALRARVVNSKTGCACLLVASNESWDNNCLSKNARLIELAPYLASVWSLILPECCAKLNRCKDVQQEALLTLLHCFKDGWPNMCWSQMRCPTILCFGCTVAPGDHMRGFDVLKLKFCQRIEAITAVEKGKYFVCTVTASASI